MAEPEKTVKNYRVFSTVVGSLTAGVRITEYLSLW